MMLSMVGVNASPDVAAACTAAAADAAAAVDGSIQLGIGGAGGWVAGTGVGVESAVGLTSSYSLSGNEAMLPEGGGGGCERMFVCGIGGELAPSSCARVVHEADLGTDG